MRGLRPYQTKAVADCRAAFASGARRVVLVSPVGSGKTVIGHECARLAIDRGRSVLWLTHRIELARQAEMPGLRVDSIQRLSASGDRPSADLVIFDECHHCPARTYEAVLGDYQSARILGLTATPIRGDGKPMAGLFDAMVLGPSMSDLLRQGHLVPCAVYAPSTEGGLAQSPIIAWQRWCSGRRGFIFCGSVTESTELADRFTEGAVIHVDGGTDYESRRRSIDLFREGSVTALSSVQIFTEGTDLPMASACLIARGCSHAGAYIQMVGRVLRPYPGKTDAIVVDLCGSTVKYGLPYDDREYSLDGKPIRKRDPVSPLSQCLACGSVFSPARKCPSCGHEGVRVVRRARVEPREIVPVSGGVDYRAAYDSLVRVARAKGYKSGWIAHVFKSKYGVWPSRSWR